MNMIHGMILDRGGHHKRASVSEHSDPSRKLEINKVTFTAIVKDRNEPATA